MYISFSTFFYSFACIFIGMIFGALLLAVIIRNDLHDIFKR